MFNIDTTSEKAIYEQIIDNIKELSLKKILRAEDKLPSVRQMATMLSVNPNTVSKAYQELERQKMIYTIRGRGTFMSKDMGFSTDQERIDNAIASLRDTCIELAHLGFDRENIVDEVDKIHREIQGGGAK